MTLIDVLIALLVIGLLFWVVRTLVPVLKIPEPLPTVIYVILVVLVALWLIGQLGGGSVRGRLW